MTTRLISLSVLLSVSATLGAQSADFGNVKAITAPRLRAHLELIADDLLEGRGTPSRGQNLAALYVSTQLKLWGVQPGGPDGTYFQRFWTAKPRVNEAESTLEIDGKKLDVGKGFLPAPIGGAVEAVEVAYMGYGARSVSAATNPYEKANVRGKAVLVLPAKKGANRPVDFVSVYDAAFKAGAAAILRLPDESTLSSWDKLSGEVNRSGFIPVDDQAPISFIPVITLSQGAAEQLLSGQKASAQELMRRIKSGNPGEPFDLVDRKINLKVVVEGNAAYTQNVVGILPGTDPKLKSEYVAFGAHIDHVGTRSTGTGDLISNGADDDGSGTVSILELAHSFATGKRPKRSLIFVWHTGEERGLWGSQYFVNNPPVPIGSIVAQLNIDMIGRTRFAGNEKPVDKMLTPPGTIYSVGSRKLSDELAAVQETVRKQLDPGLKLDFRYDQPNDPERIYYRSDHYSYASKGIPVIFFFDGVHEDYHRISDEAPKIDFDKMERVARFVAGIGYNLANRPTRPKVNAKSGDG